MISQRNAFLVGCFFVVADQLNEVGWYQDNSEGYMHDVAQLKPNAYGVYDMSGNVSEWCVDTYNSWDDQKKVIRSGDWYTSSNDCEITCRYAHSLDRRNDRLGLRLLRQL